MYTHTRADPCAHAVCRSQLRTSPSISPAAGTPKRQHSLSPRPLPPKGGPRSCSAPGSESWPCEDGTARHRSSPGTGGGAEVCAGSGGVGRHNGPESGVRQILARFGTLWDGSARLGSARRQEMHPQESDRPSQPISLWDPPRGAVMERERDVQTQEECEEEEDGCEELSRARSLSLPSRTHLRKPEQALVQVTGASQGFPLRLQKGKPERFPGSLCFPGALRPGSPASEMDAASKTLYHMPSQWHAKHSPNSPCAG
ncbi:uncharacterized protein LOC120762962 [Hirundo rustica]|uniref:uncharacterized protein LOC120762962 n=1 Tax=Hirundo rustica TaxID=43150 RepID=UPI0026736058|nr:uncharacterized protein LOC120762962 [Hirundo rustica]